MFIFFFQFNFVDVQQWCVVNKKLNCNVVLVRPGARTESTELTRIREGTRYNSEDVDTRFPPESMDDIDSRFGASTRNTINERYDSSHELDHRFSDSYQLGDNYRGRVGAPPRGIFDDV